MVSYAHIVGATFYLNTLISLLWRNTRTHGHLASADQRLTAITAMHAANSLLRWENDEQSVAIGPYTYAVGGAPSLLLPPRGLKESSAAVHTCVVSRYTPSLMGLRLYGQESPAWAWATQMLCIFNCVDLRGKNCHASKKFCAASI